MKALVTFFLLAGAAGVVLAGEPQDAAGRASGDGFDGIWRLWSLESDGQKNELAEGDRPEVVFRDGKLVINGEATLAFKLDPSTTPKLIDLTIIRGEDGRVIEGIYRRTGSRIRICAFVGGGRMRPLEFATAPGSNTIIAELRKE